MSRGRPVRPIVLVTGFGPFPAAPENPTQALVAALGQEAGGAADHELHLAVLPTRFDAAREAVLALHRRLRPHIAVHFGFDLRARGFTLERLTLNRLAAGRRDAGGARPARAAIRPGGPLACPTGLPVEEIGAALSRRGLPVAFSDDAGGYVCNLVFYAAAARRSGRGGAMAGFVHVPLLAEIAPTPAQRARGGGEPVRLARRDLIDGGRLIVATCVAAWRRQELAAIEPKAG